MIGEQAENADSSKDEYLIPRSPGGWVDEGELGYPFRSNGDHHAACLNLGWKHVGDEDIGHDGQVRTGILYCATIEELLSLKNIFTNSLIKQTLPRIQFNNDLLPFSTIRYEPVTTIVTDGKQELNPFPDTTNLHRSYPLQRPYMVQDSKSQNLSKVDGNTDAHTHTSPHRETHGAGGRRMRNGIAFWAVALCVASVGSVKSGTGIEMKMSFLAPVSSTVLSIMSQTAMAPW